MPLASPPPGPFLIFVWGGAVSATVAGGAAAAGGAGGEDSESTATPQGWLGPVATNAWFTPLPSFSARPIAWLSVSAQ